MDSLPPRQREVLYLHACEELSIVEIADVLEITTQAAKSSLSLARKSMRGRLRDLCEDRFPTG
jgi:RNA polymerase sigma factor (sigma-70 family)